MGWRGLVGGVARLWRGLGRLGRQPWMRALQAAAVMRAGSTPPLQGVGNGVAWAVLVLRLHGMMMTRIQWKRQARLRKRRLGRSSVHQGKRAANRRRCGWRSSGNPTW